MEFRRFRPEDYEAVCDFLIALNRPDCAHINWNWARFEWMYGHPEFDKSACSSIGLWLEGGAVVGAAIYDLYYGEAFCGALPEHAALYPEILDYAWRELRDENGLGVALSPSDAPALAAARAAGFSPTEQREPMLRLELDKPLAAALPTGFALTEPDPIRDAEALGWLFWQGFDHGADRAEFERTEQPPTRPRPHLNRHLGLAAVGPDGAYAAFCCLWYLPGTDYAYVEPVCTVPAQRGKGLARALLYEAAGRARALGAKRAYVISDQEFYRRIGFVEDRVFPFWRKQPAEAEKPEKT